MRQSVPLPRRSAWLFALFRKYARRYLRRHFHAVRVSRAGPVPDLPPQVRSSWSRIIPRGGTRSWAWFSRSSCTNARIHYCPIDVDGLTQYPFLERLGFFGVEVGTTRGSLAFLRQSQAILSRPESVLWITAQGEFVDPRERPVRAQGRASATWPIGCPGRRSCPWPSSIRSGTTAAPKPWRGSVSRSRSPPGASETPQVWTARIEQALEKTQDQLAEEARRRDPAAFLTVIGGTSGVGGVYDTWRRLRSAFRGESFHPEHRIAKGPPRWPRPAYARWVNPRANRNSK